MELKRIFGIKLAFALILSGFPSIAFAAYSGPVIIINEMWGSESDKIGFTPEDSGDTFTRLIKINKAGYCFIADMLNKRIKAYQPNSKLFSIIKPQNVNVKYTWPDFLDCDSSSNIYTSNYDKKIQKYDIKGNLLWEKELSVGSIYVQSDDSVLVWGYRLDHQEETCLHYSSSGQLLKTFDTRPLELGLVKERTLGNGKYESIVEYIDHAYKVNTAVGRYSRDIYGNFYNIISQAVQFANEVEPINCYTVIRVDRCTSEEYVFEPPRSEYAGYSPEEVDAPAPRQEIKIEYGEPIVSPLGDLYCWARTKTHYKILKWTWQGPEDAPQSLQISAGLSGLKLNWMKPAKDVETVTGYQIFRSTEICGPFTEVTMVKKDKLTFEDQTIKPPWKYYYVVKAVRDKKVSGDSNKVYMQWK